MRGRLITVLVLGLIFMAAFDIWVGTTKLPDLKPATSDRVYDRNGALIAAFLTPDDYWRFDASSDDIDPIYIATLIAYEDKRFYQHNGVDIWAILRAASQFAQGGKIRSGGSTLTMQVARLLERLATGSVTSKLRQIRVALALEQQLTKNEILHIYIKLAPFGGNVEGIAAASYVYLGKAPSRLTASEAALMVAIPQAPNHRRPDRNHKQAIDARNKVLNRAHLAGVFNIQTLQSALREQVSPDLQKIPRFALHMAQMHRKKTGTLTLDKDIQRKAEKLFKRKIQSQGRSISGAVIIADYKSGDIITYIGSPDFTNEQRHGYVDMANAIRSPGSTLKPFIYAKAFADGILHPQTLIADMPVRFGQYEPSNFDGTYKGMMTVHDALIGSRNIPAVTVLDKIGVNRFSAVLKRAGLDLVLPQNNDPGLAIALGGVGVSLRQMVQAYGGLANNGQAIKLHEHPEVPVKGATFINKTSALMTAQILREMPAPLTTRTGYIAYKTGTSYGHRDSWAIGFDGQHVIGVLIGRADNTAIPGAFGAELAAPILFQMFDTVGLTQPPLVLSQTTGNTVIPHHLKQFGTPAKKQENVTIIFPPEGATIEICPPGLLVKFSGGVAPYRVVLNNKLAPELFYQRSIVLPVQNDGYHDLSIVDASAAVSSQHFLASSNKTGSNTCNP